MLNVKYLDLILFLVCTLEIAPIHSHDALSKNKSILIRKHLKRLKKVDGGIRLVGGRDEYEGNLEAWKIRVGLVGFLKETWKFYTKANGALYATMSGT